MLKHSNKPLTFINIFLVTLTSRFRSSSKDGDVGRNPSLPCITRRRIATNLKSINNQKCQKIKLHGTLTPMELNKQSTRTTRPVRQQMERNHGEAVDWAGGASWENVTRQRPCGLGCLWQGSRLSGQGWLKGKLRLRVDCGLQLLAEVGQTPSLTQEFTEKWARDL